MRKARDHQGFTLIEVLIAAAILSVGLLALVSVFPVGYVDVTVSGGQSKATAYAQQMMEQLKNRSFTTLFCPTPAPCLPNPGPINGNDVPLLTPGPPPVPDTAYTRTWSITQEPGTNPPNRLARITVTVNWAGTSRSQTVALETMRAE